MHSPLSLLMIRFTFFLIFFILLFPNQTQQTTLISPVSKDKHSNLFTLSVYIKTPLRPAKLLLDLSYLYPWTVCEDTASYNSSTYRFHECTEDFCESIGFANPSPWCRDCYYSNLTSPQCSQPSTMVCATYVTNPVTDAYDTDFALVDTLALPSLSLTQPIHNNQLITLSNYTFSCAPSYFLKGLPKGVIGLAALGRSNKLTLQAQFNSAFSISRSLAVCFPGSSKSTGVAFFGTRGPYFAFTKSKKIDLSKNFTYTPLLDNPIGVGVTDGFNSPPYNEYYIGLTSIRINGQHVPINASLLTINKENGVGGTKITTRNPYTLLEPSIYKAFTELFVKEASSPSFNLRVVANPVKKPFKVCYSAKGLMVTNSDPKVPIIEFVLGKENAVWRIMGANSMVRVKNKKVDLWCLGFMERVTDEQTSIMMGGKQLEENLVHFDVESNRLGFFSLLTSHDSLFCGDFKVTDFAKHVNFFLIIFFILQFPNQTQQTTLISPVSKDKQTNLFTLSVYLKTPLRPTKLFLDLSLLFPWTVCNDPATYNSSDYHFLQCRGKICLTTPGFQSCLDCRNFGRNTLHCLSSSPGVCSAFLINPITKAFTADYVLVDKLALPSLNQSTHHGQLFSLPNYTFSCAPSFFVEGLPKGVTGLAALGRSKLSIQAQIGSRSFAICFPSSSGSTGVAFFGKRSPYFAFSNSTKIDLSKNLTYTHLIQNPIGTEYDLFSTSPHVEYYIGLTSIRVNGQRVPIKASLLTINKDGNGGAKIATRTPYTLLEPSIYKAFTELFIKEASSSRFNLTVTNNPVKPFKVCYSAKGLMVRRRGPKVPIIDFVLGKEDVVWRIMGANSMVRVKMEKVDLWCLGFMDGGEEERTSIVLGGKQLEENLVQFEVEYNRLGFFSLLNSHHSLSCADFKVTDFAKKHVK
ncbi:hypothetical protein PIB30_012425 [Stylosanthes scabra]|uniref:Peptidase A1 domain-containing protein n=1 Tax=Stylosanthes scabra TaxID=79078 RepID=A0ABU6S5W7_9FABA|nr:hypothetical protein [Stylosanthes scabra]